MAQLGPAQLPKAFSEGLATLATPRRVEKPPRAEYRRALAVVVEALELALVVACASKEPHIALVLAVALVVRSARRW